MEDQHKADHGYPPPSWADVIWTKRDGTKVPIVEMDDGHLANTLRMLRRKFVTADEFISACNYASSPMAGEMASLAVEEEIARMQIMPSIFYVLALEAARRGLAWELPR